MILYMDAPRLQRALIYVVLIVSTVASLGMLHSHYDSRTYILTQAYSSSNCG